jgi:hypothetical protein
VDWVGEYMGTRKQIIQMTHNKPRHLNFQKTQDSSVNTVTRLRSGPSKVRLPPGARDSSFPYSVHIDSVAAVFSGIGGCEAERSPALTAEVKKRVAAPTLPNPSSRPGAYLSPKGPSYL